MNTPSSGSLRSLSSSAPRIAAATSSGGVTSAGVKIAMTASTPGSAAKVSIVRR